MPNYANMQHAHKKAKNLLLALLTQPYSLFYSSVTATDNQPEATEMTNKQPQFAKWIGPQQYANTDPHPQVHFAEEAPRMSRIEVIAWAAVSGFCLAVIVLV